MRDGGHPVSVDVTVCVSNIYEYSRPFLSLFPFLGVMCLRLGLTLQLMPDLSFCSPHSVSPVVRNTGTILNTYPSH